MHSDFFTPEHATIVQQQKLEDAKKKKLIYTSKILSVANTVRLNTPTSTHGPSQEERADSDSDSDNDTSSDSDASSSSSSSSSDSDDDDTSSATHSASASSATTTSTHLTLALSSPHPATRPLGTLHLLPLELRTQIYHHLTNTTIALTPSGSPSHPSPALRLVCNTLTSELHSFVLAAPAIWASAWVSFPTPAAWDAFFAAREGEGRERVQRVRLRLLGVYATHQHDGDGDGFCMDAFRRQDLRLGILVRKVWRGVLGSLPGSVRGVDVDVGCGRHFEREKGFWLERVEGRRKRRLRVRVGGCLDWYGVEVLEGWVRRVLGGGGWEAEGEVGGRWVLVEGVGGRRVEEVGRVSGDGGVEWGEVWGSYAGRGWVEEV